MVNADCGEKLQKDSVCIMPEPEQLGNLAGNS